MKRNTLWTTGFIMLLVILFTVLRLPSLFEPYWYGDEGIYLVLGQAIRKGLTLYTQIHDNKPPTLYYLAAIANTVFGFRLLLGIFMAATIFYFHKLASKLLPLHIAKSSTIVFLILTSIPLFEGNIANAEVFMLLPTILGVYLFLFSEIKQKYLLAGLLLGFAFSIKIPVFIELLCICLWMLITQFNLSRIKNLMYSYLELALGFALPFILYAIYFWRLDAIKDFTFAAILQNFGYLSSWSTGSHSGSATNGGLVTRAIILFAAWGLIYFLYQKKIIESKLSFVLLWFAATVFGALLSTRPYPHYLIQVLPPFCMLLSISFSRTISNKVRYFVALTLLTFLAIFFRYQFYVYPVVSYYQNFYSHVFSLNSAEYRNFFGGGVHNTYQISEFLKSTTDPSKSIFVWGDEPYIYALSNRLPVGRFTVSYHIADFNKYEETMAKLEAYMPETIVYFPQPHRPFESLDKFISQYYSPQNSFGPAIIYTRLK